MKEKIKKILIISLLIVPLNVYAKTDNQMLPLSGAIPMELFVSLHMSFFVLLPLAEIISPENRKKTFWKLFAIRAAILLFFDFFITTNIAIIDFFAVFIGAFIVIPIFTVISSKRKKVTNNVGVTTNINSTSTPNEIKGIELKCAKCNAPLRITDNFCQACGAPFDGNNVVVTENKDATIKQPAKITVSPTKFDKIYSLPEDKLVEEFIKKEMVKAGLDMKTKLIPSDILKRKHLMNLIFSILVFVYISMIFFHFPISTYALGIIILIIFFCVTRKYDFMKYLKKELKARPGEKISNIIMNVKNTFTTDNTKIIFPIYLIIAIVMPLIIFSSPRIIYEKVPTGYAVRYYIFGLNNYKTVTIPETYKNEKIVSLRGNTFSNMPFLESVSLPDSITEIRGQAFKNCLKLKEVNIPTNLEYLGGGAFYNATLIKNIELPDTLTYLGGEAFYYAISLEHIKLSANLTEIRGDSFEYCKSLKSITIPDNVTRIGGHAFYGDSALEEVIISENSKLTEIGSSAFRQCNKLYSITIPRTTYVNERAFKESPTSVKRYGIDYNDDYNDYEYYYDES